MRHDETNAIAAEYMLGLLEGDDAESFRQRLVSDPSLQDASGQAADGVSLIAGSLTRVAPPPRVKARLLASIRADSPRPGLGAVRADEGNWRETGMHGITFKKLYSDKTSGLVTALVRFEPGASIPAHRHLQREQCLIIEGDVEHDGHEYGPGDFTWAEAGTIDPTLTSRNGALVLIIGGKETEKVL